MILVVYSSFVGLFLLLYIKGNLLYKNKKSKNLGRDIKNQMEYSQSIKSENNDSRHEDGFHKEIKFIQVLSEEEKKQHSLHPLYPMAYMFLSWMEHKKKMSSLFHKYIWTKQIEKIHESIRIGENKEKYGYLEKCKIISSGFLVLFLVNIFCILLFIVEMSSSHLHNGYELIRPSNNGSSNHMLLDAYIQEDGTYHKNQYEVIVEEKKHTREEAATLFMEFCEEVEQHIKGENSSMSMITKDLTFISKLPNTKIPIVWKTSHPSIINKKGNVYNGELTTSQLVEVKVILDYLGSYMEHTFYIDIYPKEEEPLSLQEALEQEIDKSMEQTQTEEKVLLPKTVQDRNVYWEEVKESKHYMVLVLGIVGVILLIYAYKKQLNSQYEKRNQQMLYDYSEVVSKLALFLRAGISLQGAWERIVLDYKSSKEEKRYIYEEMILSLHEMNLGKDELMVLEDFGKRVTIPCYLRFVSLITQNIQKGNASLLTYLEYEAKEAFMERKELIKRLGEEAGTKLLVPMMLHLVIVLLIIMVPAFLSFGL